MTIWHLSFFDLGRVKEALGHWERAVQLDRSAADSLAGRSIALESLGNWRAALAAYKSAVEWNTGSLEALSATILTGIYA